MGGPLLGGGESEIGYPKVKWVIFCTYKITWYRLRACSTVVSAHPMSVGLQIKISRQDLMGHICLGKSTYSNSSTIGYWVLNLK